jgi:26S proteasome regulatory subunit N2
MHAGTTVDTFLRENLVLLFFYLLSLHHMEILAIALSHFGVILQEWLSRATNWAKFSATAGLGVIHRGHLQQGRALMAPYLPQSGAVGGGSPYSEGGALYALGLIHANHGEGIKQFLRESLRNTSAEVIIVSSCSFLLLFISCILANSKPMHYRSSNMVHVWDLALQLWELLMRRYMRT